MIHSGRCHCGALRFSFDSDEITEGVRCNCSLCIRRGTVMSVPYFELSQTTGQPALYQWGDQQVKFWFCSRCGIHVFHEAGGRYRVNLGCIEGLDALALPIRVIDGRSFPV